LLESLRILGRSVAAPDRDDRAKQCDGHPGSFHEFTSSSSGEFKDQTSRGQTPSTRRLNYHETLLSLNKYQFD
jgi:hypothetical protein